MPALRLLAIDDPDACIARYGGAIIRAGQFIAQAEELARVLPRAAYAINLADNRYRFLVGWAAASLREQVTLLPPGKTDDVLAKLRHDYPDHHTLDDASIEDLIGRTSGSSAILPGQWQLPANRVVAIAFTSGSTGAPAAHPKTWGSLVQNTQLAAAEVLGGNGRSVVSTVPPQHMYGLEASLLGALTSNCFLYDGKPFYPADVRGALEVMPAPRALVTTPAHLKVLAESAVGLPELERVVCATAPLPVELARRVESAWRTQVLEIYGCTEAGVMAHRRPSQTECWRTFTGGTMGIVNGVAEYRAPQLAEPVPLQDVLELRSDTEFLLRGRALDMIKVAGKRASLQELTRQILAVPGVEDAVVFLPDADARPAAAVVAPGLTAAAIRTQLRARLDGVFVPRPLVLVDRLPRNSVGKLPLETLLQLLGGRRP